MGVLPTWRDTALCVKAACFLTEGLYTDRFTSDSTQQLLSTYFLEVT